MMDKSKEIEKIEKRISILKIEISHWGYYDGWTLAGMKQELSELEARLAKLKAK